MAEERKCIWCDGNPVICVLCDQEIPCMFCGGSGEFSPEPKMPSHVCKITGDVFHPEHLIGKVVSFQVGFTPTLPDKP